MAKANWLTISPISGTGNATIRNIGSEHTGRLDRTTTVTGKAVGVASEKTYSVVQHAKSEFVAANDASYQVAATGGTVTISGTSNSPLLTVTVDEGGTVGTLTVNGSQATNGQNISGDPGADAQYTWQVQIQVAENPTVNQRSLTVKVQGSSSSIADTIEVVQAAPLFTYEYVPSASVPTIAASGGNSVISAQLKTYRNGLLVSTQTVTPTLTGSATGFSISGATVTAVNRGTTVGSERSIVVTCNYVTTETGETLSDTVTISQAANGRVIVYGKPTITSFEVADIPASGGSVSSGDVEYSQSRHYYYDSGQTEELSPLTSGGQVTFGDAVSAGSLGTTVKDRTIVGQLTCQVAMNGQTSVEGDTFVYQQANEIVGEYLVDNDGCIYLGDSFNFINPTTIEIDSNYNAGYGEYGIGLEFTSGATYQPSSLKDAQQKYLEWYYDVEANINDVFSFVGDGVVCVDEGAPQIVSNSEVNGRLGVIRDCAVAENEGSSSRTGYFQWRWSHISTFTTPKVTVSQEKGVYLNVTPASLSFLASGGTKTITIDTNESWTIS